MKKLNLLLAAVLFFATAPHVLAVATNFVPLAPIPGLTDIPYASNGLAGFFNNFYKFCIGLAAVLAVIEIIWGGINISTQDSISKQGEGRERIQNALLGLVLVLSPVLVFSIINPSILNLSLNLPPINLTTGGGVGECPKGSEGVPPNCTANNPSGCTDDGNSGILKIAVCPTVEAAQTWGKDCNPALDDLSPVTTIESTDPATGIKSSKIMVTCTSKLGYVFIDTEPVISFWINAIKPVAKTTTIPPDRPNNGADAMTFVDICQRANLNLQTCLVGGEAKESPVFPCPIDPPRAGLAWKCYRRTLSCTYAPVSNTLSGKCSKTTNWSVFN